MNFPLFPRSAAPQRVTRKGWGRAKQRRSSKALRAFVAFTPDALDSPLRFGVG